MEHLLPIIVIVSVAVVAVAYGLWRWWAQRPSPPGTTSSEAPATSAAPPEAPLDTSNLFDLSRGEGENDDDPEFAVEITMMGEVPKDFLDNLEQQFEASQSEEPAEEISVDINLDGLEAEVFSDEPTHPHALILATGYARTDRGRKRPCNEDAFLILEEVPLFVVADGMGGHAAGDVASQLAVETIEACFKTKTFDGPFHRGWPRRGDELARTIHRANQAVYDKARSDHALAGMGTTVVAVRFAPNKQRVYIANVGDSRCYRIRDGVLSQLTEDHTLGALLGVTGRRARHLTQSVGIRPWVAVDLFTDRPVSGDLYLVCSDGLTKMLKDDVILQIAEGTRDIEGKCHALIDQANACGGRDNITVIAIRVDAPTDILEDLSGDAGVEP